MHVRIKLAEFESSLTFEANLKKLEVAIKTCSANNNFLPIQNYLDNINYILSPKKLSAQDIQAKNIYINQKSLAEYRIEEYNIFIDCPIEIHLISVLWIIETGHKLDEQLKANIYGFRLVRNSDNNIEEDNFKLFEKYHEKYMQFRDGALQKSIKLHEENLDVTILNLDVKSFFYNIKFNFENACAEYSETNYSKILNKIMDLIHNKYKDILKKSFIKNDKEVLTIIPIGLLSSSIVSNYVLREFDATIVNTVKPAFYSRYVDDMLIVLTNTKIEEKNTIKNILENCNFKNLGFTYEEKEEEKPCQEKDILITFQVKDNRFTFQNSKVKLFHFYKTSSIQLLEKFSNTITNNSSLFKLLPEDKDIFSTLEEASSNISYSSTINKISSINGNSLDILNISRNIVQMTKIVMNTNASQEEIDRYNHQLSNLFVGKNILELQRLWEKVFTYLFVSNSQTEFIELFKRVIEVILSIKFGTKEVNNEVSTKIENKLINDLGYYFFNSISIVISLYPIDYKNKFLSKIKNIKSKNRGTKILEVFSALVILPRANSLRNSNLIRHYMLSSIPLINYCKSKKPISFYNNEISIEDFNFNFDENKIKYSPRFIHYHEISIFYHLAYLHKKLSLKDEKNYMENEENFIFDKYVEFNHIPSEKEHFPYKDNISESQDKYYHFISNTPSNKNINIALVNMKVYVENSINSFLGKQNLSFKRLLDIFETLNNAKKTNCEMVIFPEISIPYNWLKLIADFSKSNHIAVIFGMEHFTINKYVYNFSVAILPFQVNNYTNTYIHFNLKSHYSPSEKREIEGHSFMIPKAIPLEEKIDIYKWKDAVFSIFNCYELTNIQARSKLVGENDFTVAIEYNSDTNYFSNIVGSISRDNHAYFVQVNSSQYGDSRITQPTATTTMDIIKIKGGNNTSLISGKIEIEKLRNFQSLTQERQIFEQLENKGDSYKLTPPNFKISDYRK